MLVVGGPTGVELAGALAELARTGLESEYRTIDPATARVILAQSAPRIPSTFSSALSARAERSLRDLGVDVRTGAKVTDIDEDAVAIDGIHIPARTTFWAAGVAASPAAKWLGRAADKSGRVALGPCPCVATHRRTQSRHRGAELALGLPDVPARHPPKHGKYHGRLSSRFGDRELLQLTCLIVVLVILVRMF